MDHNDSVAARPDIYQNRFNSSILQCYRRGSRPSMDRGRGDNVTYQTRPPQCPHATTRRTQSTERRRSLARIQHRQHLEQRLVNSAPTASRLNHFTDIADESAGKGQTESPTVAPECPLCGSVDTERLEFMAHRPYEVFCCF